MTITGHAQPSSTPRIGVSPPPTRPARAAAGKTPARSAAVKTTVHTVNIPEKLNFFPRSFCPLPVACL
ncbi:MAG: hypothetical protein LBS93_02235 [Synergistaceae bacterium]|nr:hypothetical protein [Synergistaceae bacterium]